MKECRRCKKKFKDYEVMRGSMGKKGKKEREEEEKNKTWICHACYQEELHERAEAGDDEARILELMNRRNMRLY